MTSLLTAVAVLAVLSSGLCEEKNFLQRAGVAFNNREYRSLLTVSNGEKFGSWTWPEMCPDNFFAVGFSLRVKSQTLFKTNLLGTKKKLNHVCDLKQGKHNREVLLKE